MSTTDPYFTLAQGLPVSQFSTRDSLVDTCRRLGLKLVVEEKDRGDNRKAHYGSGKQPWDVMLENGWAPVFAAGNVLKYMRREKDVDNSREKARWYYAELYKLCHSDTVHTSVACDAFDELRSLLTEDELLFVGRGI